MWVALCAVTGLLGFAAPAKAAEVEVVPLSGPSQIVSLDGLAGQEDVVEREYTVRSGQGDSTRTVTGFSLAAVLEQGNVDGFTFSYVEIERPDGGALLLDNEQVRDAEGLDGPPVIAVDGADARFLRPSTGAGDANAVDEFAAPRLVVREREGQLIDVEASASEDRVEVGERVTFTASVSQSAAGLPVTLSWSFRDGTSGSGPRVTHRFREAGTYDVVVGATSPGDDTGGSDAVEVVVGEPKEGGPDRRGGGDNAQEDAPDSGQASGQGGAGEAGDASSAPAASPTDQPAAGASQTPAQAPEAPDRPERDPDPAELGSTVEGELLTGVAGEPVADAQPPAAGVAARTGTPTDEGGFTVPGVIIGSLIVSGLVGVGALGEFERLSLPRRREETL